MLHETLRKSARVTKASERSFGLVMSVACAVLGGLAWWRNPDGAAVLLFAGFCFLFLLLALFWNAPLRPLNAAWLKLGEILHKIVSPVVLGAMFFLVITPIGALMRLAGKDPLNLRLDPGADSYWIRRDPDQAADMTKQF